MKKLIFKGFAVLTLMAITSCKNEVKNAETSEAKTVEAVETAVDYNTISSNSAIIWKANKIVGGHQGTISVSKGTVNIKNNTLVSGGFTLNINSLACTDIPKEKEENGKLVGHLLSADFFDAEKFPTAKFEITKVEASKVSGNLTLKGISKNVTFDAKINITDNSVVITSETFTIDRTEWNINHNSGKIMDAAKLGDYLIKDDVELTINVTVGK